MEKGLNQFFTDYVKKESLFASKKALQSNYIPDMLEHRDEEINQIAQVLAPVLRGDRPSNLFIYGKTGTGKTVSIKHVTQNLVQVAKNQEVALNVCYVNCKLKKITDTEYRLIAHLSRELGKEIPATGLPTDEVYKIFLAALEEAKTNMILVLDEIDHLVQKAGDELLYNLVRHNAELENSQIAVVGISNDLVFTDHIDPRVKSSLSEEELLFAPYNALQIQDILRKRTSQGFGKGKIEPGVVEKCAAFAAREHGDARRAIDLLRVAGELAERNNEPKVCVSHLDVAEAKIEKDRVVESVTKQPKQVQAVLHSIFHTADSERKIIFTGEVYSEYSELCAKIGLRPLTQRRVSDVIGELDMLGIINARVISKGRYGRTREITIPLAEQMVEHLTGLLKDALFFS
jgi:cell division control protein 6